jgi:thiol-disulfide isomerase/thioredoxin
MRTAICFVLLCCWLEISYGQDIPEIDREAITELSHKENDTTYVINFWATWCSPCVKEIGYFEELHKQYASQKLQVILVSLDFPNQKERRVVPFLKEKGITAPVKLMADLDYNSWIDKVDPSWSGALPATLIYNTKERVFLEKELTRSELNEHVKQILN